MCRRWQSCAVRFAPDDIRRLRNTVSRGPSDLLRPAPRPVTSRVLRYSRRLVRTTPASFRCLLLIGRPNPRHVPPASRLPTAGSYRRSNTAVLPQEVASSMQRGCGSQYRASPQYCHRGVSGTAPTRRVHADRRRRAWSRHGCDAPGRAGSYWPAAPTDAVAARAPSGTDRFIARGGTGSWRTGRESCRRAGGNAG